MDMERGQQKKESRKGTGLMKGGVANESPEQTINYVRPIRLTPVYFLGVTNRGKKYRKINLKGAERGDLEKVSRKGEGMMTGEHPTRFHN